jgi:hypothetical protein
MESFKDDKLAATLSALRPAPRPAFTAELDDRVAAGFPRQTASTASLLSRVVERLRGLSPRRALVPAVATALVALVAATLIVATGSGDSDSADQVAIAPTSAGRTQATLQERLSKQRTDPQVEEFFEGQPEKSKQSNFDAAGPVVRNSGSVAVEASGTAVHSQIRPSFQGLNNRSASYASAAPHRDVERSAEMVLGADPAEVSDDAAKVFAAVHAVNGIVLRSSTSGGPAGRAGAEFELLIPSARLGDALAAFSGIAEVRSRHEATNDITAPTVNLSERLQDSKAKIESLLNDLAATETEAERDAVEAQLRTERSRAAFLRSQLSNLQRKASFSRVSLRIETGATSSSSGGGGWSIGDALHDAGHILAVAAGVAIIGLAILAPLALIAALIWLANRAWVRRGRQRALG